MHNLDILEILCEEKRLTSEQAADIRRIQSQNGKDIIEILEDERILKEEQIIRIISKKINVPYINLNLALVDKNIISFLSEDTIKNNLVLPIFKIQDNLTVGMVNPTDLYLIDELKQTTKLNISPVLVSQNKLMNVITQYFGIQDSLGKVIDKLKDEFKDDEKDTEFVDFQEAADESSIVKLVNILIEQAIIDRASDIHIEPQTHRLRVRYRIDGSLHEIQSIPRHLSTAVISRLKVLSRLDISEKRIPQDGRIKTKINDREVDIRVSTSPTIFGEKIVLRIFDKSQMLTRFENLGLDEQTVDEVSRVLKMNSGIFLVTGPTGSGKTTTLYAALNQLDSVKDNIVTIEDPVEYQLENINQIEVNPRINLTFANGLRSILRQDPDIIMVGEIRDYETAEITIRSALTGHFVLSTLHTNNSTDSLARLIDMGVEPYLLASTVKAVLAQRLVRMLCRDCRETFMPPQEILIQLDIKNYKDMVFYTSRGCKSCKYTGYQGRTGVFEILIMNDTLRELVMQKASAEEMRTAAIKTGLRTIREDALDKINSGLTCIDEIMNSLYGVF